MTLIRVDDMYNVSLLSWMGNPDIFHSDPKIYDIENARCIVGLFWLVFRMQLFKGGRMGRSDTVSLWGVSLLINTRFRFFILE